MYSVETPNHSNLDRASNFIVLDTYRVKILFCTVVLEI